MVSAVAAWRANVAERKRALGLGGSALLKWTKRTLIRAFNGLRGKAAARACGHVRGPGTLMHSLGGGSGEAFPQDSLSKSDCHGQDAVLGGQGASPPPPTSRSCLELGFAFSFACFDSCVTRDSSLCLFLRLQTLAVDCSYKQPSVRACVCAYTAGTMRGERERRTHGKAEQKGVCACVRVTERACVRACVRACLPPGGG